MNHGMCKVKAQILLLRDSHGSTWTLGAVRCDRYGKKRFLRRNLGSLLFPLEFGAQTNLQPMMSSSCADSMSKVT
jgi:hypothetical protein